MRPPPELAGRRVPVVIVGGLLSVLLVVAGVVTGVRRHGDKEGVAAGAAPPTTAPAPFITALRTAPEDGDSDSDSATTAAASTAPAASAPAPTTAAGGDASSPTVLPATPIAPATTAPVPGADRDPAPSTGPVPTAGAPATTAATGPPPSLPPAPAPPHTGTLLGPADRPALQQSLATLGFPAWWPLPDAVATTPPLPTVQALHRGTAPGATGQVANDWASTWYVPTSDLDAVRRALVAQLPADVFDVDNPQTVTGQQGGARFTQLTFTPLPPATTRTTASATPPVTSFTLLVYDAVTADGGQRVGAFVDQSAEGSAASTPAAAALDDTIVGWSRSLPAADGLTLSGVDLSASRSTSALDGSVRLRYDIPVANLPADKAFYADAANWTGSARPSAVLADTSDGWSVPFTVAGRTGQLSASNANLAGAAAVTVELALAP